MAKNVIISDAFQDIQYIDSLELSRQINNPLNITPTFPTSFTNSVGVYCPAYTGTSGSYEFTFPITTTYKTFRLNNNYVVSNDEYPADNYIQTIMIPINLPAGCGDFQVTPYFHNSTVPAYIKQNSTFGIISSDTTVESNTIQFACESSNGSLIGQLEEGPSGIDALASACGYFESATGNPVYEVSGSSLTSTTSPSFSSGLTTLSTGIYILYYSIFTHIDGTNPSVCPSWSITCTGDPDAGAGEPTITEFAVASSNTNKWASVTTDAVGGSTKYGICVTNASNPRYTFQNVNFYPTTTSGSVAIVELYANSEGYDTGDPNITTNFTINDGVALTNASTLNMGALSSNDAVYGINANTKQANYVYNFTNNGYADTKKMAIGGNKNRRVFAIRSWGSLNVNYNKPSIAFIGNKDTLYYDGTSKGYSVGCAGATRTTDANTWVHHTAGDGTKYYSITNTATNVNASASITLTEGHTYRFTLHVNSEYKNDGVAICKTTNTTSFNALSANQLLSGNITTGMCSGPNTISTFEYTELNTGEVGEEKRYIYFKSNSSIIGSSTKDTKSFADVMVEDLGDLREEQPAPLASNVTKEYGETATGGVSRLSSGYGDLQYRTINPNGILDVWSKTPPKRTEIGETQYQARYRGDATHKASPASTATLKITPKKITKPTAVTGLVYNGSNQNGVKNSVGMPYATTNQNEGGTTSAKNAGNYSITYTLHDTTIYCWSDGTTAPATVNWSIAPLEAALSWGSTLTWLYDGNSHSTTCTVSNLIGSDTCTVTLSGNSITNVGTTTVTATALSNSNYKLPANNTATLTINPCMYFKKAGSWVPVKEVYKKVNGSWVKQTTTIGDVFSTSGKYLGRYRNGSTWVNLIEEKS